MKTYYFLEKPNEEPIIIEDGFNFYCLFLGMFWAIYKGIWKLSIIFISVFITSVLLKKFSLIDSLYIDVARIAISIALSFHANDFYKKSLQNKGYRLAEIICSESKKNALIRFLDKKIFN